eukprot:scaffold18482_cov94-Skeletonema_dohrnii-CCMP3373.AAC.1
MSLVASVEMQWRYIGSNRSRYYDAYYVVSQGPRTNVADPDNTCFPHLKPLGLYVHSTVQLHHHTSDSALQQGARLFVLNPMYKIAYSRFFNVLRLNSRHL